MAIPCVFISYSHCDEQVKSRLVWHLERALALGGVEIEAMHDGRFRPGAPWAADLRSAIERAVVTIILVSPSFLESDFCMQDELPRLRAALNERGTDLLPVLVVPCNWRNHHLLRELQLLTIEGSAISLAADPEAALQEVARQAAALACAGVARAAQRPPDVTAPTVDLTQLATTGVRLLGRVAEIEKLDLAWLGHARRIVCIEGAGGDGKTTLARSWIERLLTAPGDAPRRVFGFTFRATDRASRETSAEACITSALHFFGGDTAAKAPPWDRGSALAHLVGAGRNLIVLDGVELLLGPPDCGRAAIMDHELASFLEALAAEREGCCLLTSRVAIVDLERLGESTAVERLTSLDAVDAIALLRAGGASGSDEQLAAAAASVGGHALAVRLLPALLRLQPSVARLKSESVENGEFRTDTGAEAPARRVLAEFERALDGGPSLELLRLLALDDEPLGAPELAALLAPPAIPGLTEKLIGLDLAARQLMIDGMVQWGLLAPPASRALAALDCHALVREHFAAWLKQNEPVTRVAHARLFAHLASVAAPLPETREAMAPLYRAVIHGCRAGQRQRALDDVFYRRIQRGRESWNVQYLGAYGADLAMCRALLDEGFQPPSDLSEGDHDYVLNCAGFDLAVVGRAEEAEACMQTAMQAAIAGARWREASVASLNLADNRRRRGDLAGELEAARRAVEFAERDPEAELAAAAHASVGLALHDAGQPFNAIAEYERARQLHQVVYGRDLVSSDAHHFADLLRSIGRRDEAEAWVRRSLADDESNGWLLERSVDLALLAEIAAERGRPEEALRCAEESVDGLQRLSAVQHVPRALLSRSRALRAARQPERAAADALRAERIARVRGFRLDELLAHVAHAEVLAELPDATRAARELAAARAVVRVIPYRTTGVRLDEVERRLDALRP